MLCAILCEVYGETYIALLSFNAAPRSCARAASWRDRIRKIYKDTLHGWQKNYVTITSDDCDRPVHF